MKKIILGDEGYIENGTMTLFSINEDTQKELIAKKLIKDNETTNISISDIEISQALYTRWLILKYYNTLIDYESLWIMLSDKRYIDLWKDEVLESISDTSPREYLFEIYIDIKIQKSLVSVQKSLKGRRLDLSCEKRLQVGIEKAFKEANLSFEREVVLDEKSIVDFMIDKLAIEVKIYSKASAMSIYRQLERYAENDKVNAILLVTSKTMSLPEFIKDKPAYVLSLGRAQI